jgi:hypothetical protein
LIGTKKYGMPAWALFKPKPLDGDYEAQTPEGGLEVHAFDWKEGMQYWWTCEYDAFEDRMRQEGKQAVIVDEDGHEEALAVYVGWGTAEIARHVHKIFTVHECKEVVVRETKENVYAWRVIRRPGAPEAKKLAIALGTKRLAVEIEEGDNNTLGEWLSRKTGYIIPPLGECQRTEGQIGHPNEPVKLWTGVTGVKTVHPTMRKKEHVLAFRVANKVYMSKPAECTFPYDLDEIMSVGHELLERIPEQPTLAEFPAQPWGHRVNSLVKRRRTRWEIKTPFGDQEEEAWAEEAPATVRGRIMARNPRLPPYHEIGLTPKGLSVRMVVTMPRKEVEIAVGATIGGKWIQASTTTDWLRDPEKLVQDCVRMLGAPPAMAGRFRIEDTRPWKTGNVLTVVEVESNRPIRWSIPAKDGSRYVRNWETEDTLHWAVQYDKEYGKLAARERGNWYESRQLRGPDPPYSTEIVLELRSGKTKMEKKQTT